MKPTVTVTGTEHKPVLEARFDYSAKLVEKIKELPDRKWKASEKYWRITGVGPHPQKTLEEAGFDIEWTEEFDDIDSLDELAVPRAKLAEAGGGVYIRPRLLGRTEIAETIGPGALWESDKDRFWVPLAELADIDFDFFDDDIRDAIDEAAENSSSFIPEGAYDYRLDLLACQVSAAKCAGQFGQITADFADVPDWYGLNLYEYQRLGAIAAFGGFRLICDEPGLGKTRTALAAAAIAAPERTLIVVPPVAVTHWAREATVSRLAYASELTDGQMSYWPGYADPAGGDYTAPGPDPAFAGRVAAIRAGRKTPELPDRGVVVVADSYLSGKPELQALLAGWSPDVLIDDEIHRHANPEAKRTRAAMVLAQTAPMRLGISGTPILHNPAQLPSQLFISGRLDAFDGQIGKFLETYCRPARFGGWTARKAKAGQLGKIMDSEVWVRRTKRLAQPQLPEKTRRVEWLDVPLTEYRKAVKDCLLTMDDAIERFIEREDRLPRPDEIETVAGDLIRFSSPLRLAAGRAKIDDAAEWITDHLTSTGTTEDADGTVYDRPIIAWVWHNEVADGLAEELAEFHPAVFTGRTSATRRDEIVDQFQDGRIGVLIASIAAANVAITLTAACDAVFVESDWVPANISQAEDRINRIGQTRPVTITTLSAVGTLDERMHGAQIETYDVLEKIMKGGDNLVSGAIEDHAEDPMMRLADVVADIFAIAIKRWSPKTLRRKK